MAEKELFKPVSTDEQIEMDLGRGSASLTDYAVDPDVASWVRKAAERGLFQQAVLWVRRKIGSNASYRDVVKHLNEVGALVVRRPGVSLRKDFGNNNSSTLRRLEDIFGVGNNNIEELEECRYGVNTHALILDGLLQLVLTDDELHSLSLPKVPITMAGQRLLFDSTGQMLFFRLRERFGFAPTLERQLQEKIRAYFWELQQYVPISAWVKKGKYYESVFKSFQQFLYPLIRDHTYYRNPHSKKDSYTDTEYLNFLSQLTLAGIICGLEKFPFVFPEVRIFLPKHGARGGKIDGLEVLSIDGHPPTEEQKRELSQLYFTLSPKPFVGELIYAIYQHFGRNVCFRIMDIKCAVGDAKGLRGILWPEHIKEGAIGSHIRQIKQYLVLSAVSFHIARWLHGETDLLQDVWLEEPPVVDARLVYCFPNGQVEFGYSLDAVSQRKYFIRRIARNAWRLEVSGRGRAIDAALTGYIKDLAQGMYAATQLVIPQVAEYGYRQRPFQRIIASYRRQVGLGNVAEYVGEGKSGPRYILFADKLISLIETGQIPVDEDFSLERDSFICCPFHRIKGGRMEETPSCRLYWANPEKATFHCYGYGASGKIMGRIERDGKIIALTPSFRRSEDLLKRIIRRREDAVISDEHQEIVLLAKRFMAADLEHNPQGQPGRDYLRWERGLDLDLAFSKGFGFGNDIIPVALLEEGFSFEQLIKYGFISFSNRARKTIGLVPLLKHWGLKEKEIMRDGAYPFFVFRDMVTVPLELLAEVYSSFYARSVRPDVKIKHRKLRVVIDGASVPHGAFNLELLDNPACQELVLTEGVMDAMVLLMLGFDAMAILGADNNLIIDSIARSNKHLIALAFDRDIPGRKAALKVAKKLRELGFKGRIVNFNTAGFYQLHPEAARYKDINQWWTECGIWKT